MDVQLQIIGRETKIPAHKAGIFILDGLCIEKLRIFVKTRLNDYAYNL